MSQYFAKFPTISYSIEGSNRKNRKILTNTMARVVILDKLKNNVYSYYPIFITDEDTPDILAYKYYGNSEYHWIIMLANDMIDGQYDWPLKYNDFLNYIISKYGSLETAKTTIHHYEKIIKRTHTYTNTVDTSVYELQLDDYNDLAGYTYETFNLADNTTLIQETTKKIVYAYDYENDVNEKKRSQKIIKVDYLSQILEEFNALIVNQ